MSQLFEAEVAKRVPILRSFAERLSQTADAILDSCNATGDDNFGVMAVCFVNKQSDHLKAIITLLNHRDSELVARSMIEGLAYFLWAYADADYRSRRWREWAYVHNYRLAKEDPELYRNAGSDLNSVESKYAEEVRVSFYNGKAKEALSSGRPLPENPFVQNWTGLSVTKVIKEVSPDNDGIFIYYKRFSEWHHWNFVGMARALDASRENAVSYKSESTLSHAQALVVGFQCLFQICEITNQHFKMNFAQQLRSLSSEFLQVPKPKGG